ncbi:DUF1207 domain-containing protein [Spirosoma utsteinense]|uniref:DUF1207 domain-containing protein n=1 Tax=Spirosoma utsteinense TaxID=2585773 RepID=A0ABR6W2E0_9BACT|nr:DUF1207 domain-containing protein [Spirosoma utsteinense]MBC3784429.1 hypothetical protein [Spirosoma utsteinense]MBC3790771.1 hypothetical protein [Spirosoma utsteinense]
MKKLLFVLLLSGLAGTSTLAQQTPANPSRTTPPASRTLTPAEQKQKDRIDREVQRDRQIRAEWAQKQREYEAKQAEKERQRQAKKAAKERDQSVKEAPVQAPAPVPSTTAPTPTPAPQPAAPAAAPEPSRKEKREKRRQEQTVEPAPSAPAPIPDAPAPVETRPREPKPERVKRERAPRPVAIDSASATGTEPAMSRSTGEFLPKGHLFDPILLDPLEAQTYGSLLPVYNTEGKRYKGSIVPFAFGFAKPFYRRTKQPGHSSEWVLDLASFTQFEAYRDATLDKARRRILNTDYKVSIIYNVRRGANTYRFRVYHLSSHLGDDYIFRNNITAPTANAVNYELLDVTYSRMIQTLRLYGGIGFVLRKAEERKLLSAQLGAYYKKPSDKAARLVGGLDVKFWQQTDFRPGIHGGIGVEVGRTQNNLTFMLEGYSGFRPYSQFENQQTSWIGVGLYLNPF